MIDFNYFDDNGNLEINGIKNGDIILIQYKDSTYAYKYLENNGKKLVNINLNDIKIFEKTMDDIHKLNLSLDKDDFNVYINGDIDKFNEIYVNDVKFEKTDYSFISQNQYYKDNKVKIELNDKDRLTFKKDGKIIEIYRINNNKLEVVKEVKSAAAENSVISDIPKVKEEIKTNTSTLVKINKITEKSESFDNYLKIEPKEAVKSIDSINLNGNNLKLVGSKIAVFSDDSYYIDKDKGYIYLPKFPKENSKIIFKNKENIIGSFIKSNDNNYQIKEDLNENKKKLHVKIKGSFEPAITGQKKYDAISGATGMVNNNTNSNVKVYVAETDNESADYSDFKPVSETDIKLTTNNKLKSKGIISPSGSGMSVSYNNIEGSILLQGIPEKEGDYSVHLEVVDNLGRTVTSNELPFKIFSLDNTKLTDVLKKESFSKFKFGNEKKWDMEPWSIKHFGGENETVTVPKELIVWFGSHESGKYGYLGNGVFNDVIPQKQTLILEKDAKLTLVNMQLLSSVNVIVKDGATLNLNDCSVYGNIIVENGGILQVNYDNHSKKLTTGTSINGKIILKDGAVLENSTIYSNANNLTDGNKARKIVEPVVEVQGNATIKGHVFIRGDESPTGIDPETNKEYKGQPALKISNGSLKLSEKSLLGLYGGGVNSTTTNGGDAVILDNGTISGEGSLIAVGGTAGGFSNNNKGGSAIVGTGSLNISKAFLQGGYSTVKNKSSYGSATEGNINISKDVNIVSKDGNNISSLNTTIPEVYWSGTIAPGNDKNNNPLKAEETKFITEQKSKLNSENSNTNKDKTKNKTSSEINNEEENKKNSEKTSAKEKGNQYKDSESKKSEKRNTENKKLETEDKKISEKSQNRKKENNSLESEIRNSNTKSQNRLKNRNNKSDNTTSKKVDNNNKSDREKINKDEIAKKENGSTKDLSEQFTDIKNHWANEAIKYVINKGYFK